MKEIKNGIVFSNDIKQILNGNNAYKIKSCSEKCGTSCYGTKETQCACATNSYYDYILHKDNSYQCKKLPYYDFKRYSSYEFNIVKSDIKGFDFWFYFTFIC